MKAGRMETAREFQSRNNETLYSFDSKYIIFPIMLFLFPGQCCIQRRNGYSGWPRDTRSSWRKRASWTSWFWSTRLTWWKGHPRCIWPPRASWCPRWVGLCVLLSKGCKAKLCPFSEHNAAFKLFLEALHDLLFVFSLTEGPHRTRGMVASVPCHFRHMPHLLLWPTWKLLLPHWLQWKCTVTAFVCLAILQLTQVGGKKGLLWTTLLLLLSCQLHRS